MFIHPLIPHQSHSPVKSIIIYRDTCSSISLLSCCSFGNRTEFVRRRENYRMAACWKEHCLRCNRRSGDRQLLLLLLPPSNNPSSALLIVSIEKAICSALVRGEEAAQRIISHPGSAQPYYHLHHQLVSLVRLDPVSQLVS